MENPVVTEAGVAVTVRGIVTKKNLPQEYGITGQTAHELEKTDPVFPRRVQLTDHRVGWWRHELDTYFLKRPRAKPHPRAVARKTS